MEAATMKVYACPTCGCQLEREGAAYRCTEHGLWYAYGANLLVLAPSHDQAHDRFTMPWEQRAAK